MKRKFLKVDISVPLVDNPYEVAWALCMLCQKDSSEKLVYPCKNTRGDRNEGYGSLFKRLVQFHEIGQLPFKIPENLICEEETTAIEFLSAKNAAWHKSCYDECNSNRLERAKKRAGKMCNKENNIQFMDCSPVKTRSLNPPYIQNTCVFCTSGDCQLDADCDTEQLFRVGTEHCNANMKKLALYLRDFKLLAKLEGAFDLMASDIYYHNNCYADLKNIARAKEAEEKKKEIGDKQTLRCIALSHIVSYINEVRISSGADVPVFSMAKLTRMYVDSLKDLGIDCDGHSTRLRDTLLKSCPYLEECGSGGQEILITFRKDLDIALRSMIARDLDTNRQHYHKAAEAVRRSIFQHEPRNWKDMALQNQSSSVPADLINMVQMIISGPSCETDETGSVDQAALTIAQLLFYHAVKRRKGTKQRHDSNRETPAPVYLALKLHAETRKKELVDVAHKLGLCISYERMQTIIADTANSVCERYHKEGVVCPPALVGCIFTSAAADNFNHNTSSTTAKDAFNGTAISLVQHMQAGEEGIQRDEFVPEKRGGKTVKSLPAYFSNVQPCFLNPKSAKFPKSELCFVEDITPDGHVCQEVPWLEKSRSAEDLCVPWAVHHAREETTVSVPCNIAVMPLFKEPSDSMAMMFHAMTVAKAAINHINPCQTPVIAVDQPLYALCKTIQFLDPDSLGESKYFVMMGSLHVEMNALKMIGSWLEDSGWVSALVQAEITTTGRAESMLKATHVTRTRRAHEITAAVLYDLQISAYTDYVHSQIEECNEWLEMDEWREERRKNVPQFHYWDIVMNLELILLQFVRSIRTANFTLYKEALSRLVVWFFALDHINYARWVSVHICDLLQIDSKLPNLASEFRAGKFVAGKTARPFSKMGLDHLHEQVNAILKSDGGIIGLTEKPETLKKVLLAAPEIASLIQNFEENAFACQAQEVLHHSEKASVMDTFKKDLRNLKAVFEELGNPFQEDSKDLYNLDTKEVASEAAVNTVMHIEELGLSQYREFAEKRLATGSKMEIFDPIKKNKYALLSTSPKRQSKVAAKLADLKSDCQLFSRLYIACQNRDGDLDELFRHENHEWPPSLAVSGGMRSCKKSDLIQCLAQTVDSSLELQACPKVDVKILDGAAVVHMIRPGTSATFQDYINEKFLPYIKRECETVKRIDAVWDRYFDDSLKSATREKRGDGTRMRVTLSTKMPKGWPNFLRSAENKESLFHLLARAMTDTDFVSSIHNRNKEFYSTYESDVLTNSRRPNLDQLRPCNHEEADGRLMLHVKDAVSSGLTSVMVKTVDTDVLVLAVACFCKVDGLKELWVSLGKDKDHRYIPAHEIAAAMGPQKSYALLGFHSFTGCDTVSSFGGKGKKTAFKVWDGYPEATGAFLLLLDGKVEEAMKCLEVFVTLLYDRSSPVFDVDVARRELFSKKNRQIDNIPPTRDALAQHSKRASLQAMMWKESLQTQSSPCDPALWGWKKGASTTWVPEWTTLPPAARSCRELVKCGCKTCVHNRCSCSKSGMPCCELCTCPCNKNAE